MNRGRGGSEVGVEGERTGEAGEDQDEEEYEEEKEAG